MSRSDELRDRSERRAAKRRRRATRCAALAVASAFACIATSCANLDANTAAAGAVHALQAATLSDDQVKSMADQAAVELDQKHSIAPPDSAYAKRLDRIVRPHRNEGGLDLDIKVYETADVNAFAMANGTVRVYSGLMDLMNDDELLFVLGHEIGHVELGHTRKAMQVAYAARAARIGAASAGGAVGAIAQSELGTFTEQLVNAQFSQREELQADSYSLDFFKKHGYPPQAAVSALRKLGGGPSHFLSSHPDSESRARRIEQRIAKGEL